MARVDHGLPITLPYDPATGGDDVIPVVPPGTKVSIGGKTYKYVKFNNGTGNVAAVAGGTAHWKDADFDPPEVVSDQTDALAGVNGVAGVFLNVPTDGRFCWVQCGGYKAAIKTAVSVVTGDALIGSTTDLECARVAANTAPTNQVVAWATGSVASGFSPGFIVIDP